MHIIKYIMHYTRLHDIGFCMSEAGRLGSLSVGNRLKLARDMRGLTMAELGDRAGVGASTVNVIEKGSKQPRGDTVEKLARALGVPRCWLAYGDGQPPDWTEVNSAEQTSTPTSTEKRDIKRRLADLLAEVAVLKAEVDRLS